MTDIIFCEGASAFINKATLEEAYGGATTKFVSDYGFQESRYYIYLTTEPKGIPPMDGMISKFLTYLPLHLKKYFKNYDLWTFYGVDKNFDLPDWLDGRRESGTNIFVIFDKEPTTFDDTRDVCDYRRFEDPSEWFNAAKELGMNPSTPMMLGITDTMEKMNVSFAEAFELLEEHEKIMLVGKFYIFDESYTELF